MISIDLYVFWLSSDADYDAQNCGIDIPPDESSVRLHTFYNIDWIRPYNEKYCSIFCGGEIYIVNDSYESVKLKIENQIVYKFN